MIDVNNARILIVDDLESMRRALYGLLKVMNLGKHCYFAPNGLEALKILRKGGIDLVLTDLNMPVMDGVELLASIREDMALRDTPVIIISGEAKREVVAQAAESDLNSYIVKPITAQTLHDRIFKLIDAVNHPTQMVEHLRRSRAYEEQCKFDLAVREVRQAIAANPDSSRPLRELGYLLYRQEDFKEARRFMLQAVNKNDLDVFAYHYLGEIYTRLENYETAAMFYEKAMAISPRNAGRSVSYGEVLLCKGEQERARALFDNALSLTDRPLFCKQELAEICLRHDYYDYAVPLLKDLIKDKPGDSDLSFKLGKAYEGLGQHHEAVKCLSGVGESGGEATEIKLHIASNYLALGWPMHAERVLLSILASEPDNQEAVELLKNCKE